MNRNLSKLGGQLRDIWAQLGASQRITIASATLVVIAGLVALALWSSHTQYALLYGRLSDRQASKVISALNDAKVPYKIGAGGSSILVPADKVYLMRMQLASKGIPQSDGVGFEILDKPNFGISDFMQRANFTRAVEGELARTISQLDSVDSARVMIVMPQNRLLLDRNKHPTASVFLRMDGNTQLKPEAVSAIRFLVANSVEGLKPNNVAVVDNMGNVLSEDDDNNSIGSLTSSQLAARRNLEQYLSKKAQDMLEKVLGPGQAIVRVSADINFDSTTTTQETYDPNGQVVVSQTKNDDTTDSKTANPGSRPVGISANTSTATNNLSAAAGPVNNSHNQRTTSTIQYDVPKTTSNIIQAAGGIKRLTAAVMIAARYKGTGANRKMVPRTPEELAKLRSIVESALGIPAGPNNTSGDQVTLEEMPFNTQFATNLTQEMDQQQQQQFWWDLARNSIYPGLGLVALAVLLILFKRTPVQEIPIGVPVGRLVGHRANGHADGNGNGNGNGHGNGHGDWTREAQPGVVTVDVLNRLVKENPANMTQAIHDWLNKSRTSE